MCIVNMIRFVTVYKFELPAQSNSSSFCTRKATFINYGECDAFHETIKFNSADIPLKAEILNPSIIRQQTDAQKLQTTFT